MPVDTERSTAASQAAFARAQQLMPGGVSSPVRAFKGVGGSPLFIKEADGCIVTDLDNNKYIDYVGSYGPMIVGHAHERVITALSKAIGRGTSYGAPTEQESQLAAMIIGAVPSVEMIRFVNSGTEAVMSALRLARAATGRDLVIKCIGCYHGHSDAMLVEAGSGALTLGTPSSPGVVKCVASSTVSVAYNDLDNARAAFETYPGRIACFIVEPVAGNMGLVPPVAGYLAGLRKLCDEHGAMLLFDEVMSGFRVAWGGAQARYDVKPDITALGKIIGGGLPVGAYGASRKLMEMISPSGPVYQAGTLSGNPLAMRGGMATLEILAEPGAYEFLEDRTKRLEEGLIAVAGDNGIPLAVNRVGSMICVFFVPESGRPVGNFAQATHCDTARYAAFFHEMLDHGIYLPPSQYESWFVSLAHNEDVIERTLEAADQSLSTIAAAK